jgi:pentatricopeptide repeat protein
MSSASPGRATALTAPDLLRAQRLATAEAALRNAEEEEATGVRPTGEGAPGWRAYCYTALPSYRSLESHELVHYRLLEAAAQRDLDAVWALWAEHCRMAPQDGDPDHLALEIVADACIRAKRTDLVYHALWPRMVQLHMVPTPEFRFLLLKAAAMDGDAGRAVQVLEGLRKEGLPTDERHYSAAVSACLRQGRWEQAFRFFNLMRSSGMPVTADLFSAFFTYLHAAGRATECKSAWRAMAGTPGLVVPFSLYAQVVETFAEQGDIESMEEAATRMGRVAEKTPGQKAKPMRPDAQMALAMFGAYAAAGVHDKAKELIKWVEGSWWSGRTFFACAHGPPPPSPHTHTHITNAVGPLRKGTRC